MSQGTQQACVASSVVKHHLLAGGLLGDVHLLLSSQLLGALACLPGGVQRLRVHLFCRLDRALALHPCRQRVLNASNGTLLNSTMWASASDLAAHRPLTLAPAALPLVGAPLPLPPPAAWPAAPRPPAFIPPGLTAPGAGPLPATLPTPSLRPGPPANPRLPAPLAAAAWPLAPATGPDAAAAADVAAAYPSPPSSSNLIFLPAGATAVMLSVCFLLAAQEGCSCSSETGAPAAAPPPELPASLLRPRPCTNTGSGQ